MNPWDLFCAQAPVDVMGTFTGICYLKQEWCGASSQLHLFFYLNLAPETMLCLSYKTNLPDPFSLPLIIPKIHHPTIDMLFLKQQASGLLLDCIDWLSDDPFDLQSRALDARSHQILVQFICLKMLSELTLMYQPTVSLLLRKDSEPRSKLGIQSKTPKKEALDKFKESK